MMNESISSFAFRSLNPGSALSMNDVLEEAAALPDDDRNPHAAPRSSLGDALGRLQQRGAELARLANQPPNANRTPLAPAAHLFASDAQALLEVIRVLEPEEIVVPVHLGLQKALRESLREPMNTDAADDQVPPSFQDTLDDLQALIDIIRIDYLDIYAALVEKYAALYSDFNSKILALLEKWIVSKGDKGNIELDCEALGAALDASMLKYRYPSDDAILFPASGKSSSKEDAEKWLKAMGLPETSLVGRGDGTYCVVIDVTPLKSMKDNLPGSGKVELSAAKFQAWQSAFNAQQQAMESTLQTFTQKYSNANSIHDNVQKTISSTLSSLFDMLKAFAASL